MDKHLWKGGNEMYIPEFWCGVLATILVIVAAIIIAAIVMNRKDKK